MDILRLNECSCLRRSNSFKLRRQRSLPSVARESIYQTSMWSNSEHALPSLASTLLANKEEAMLSALQRHSKDPNEIAFPVFFDSPEISTPIYLEHSRTKDEPSSPTPEFVPVPRPPRNPLRRGQTLSSLLDASEELQPTLSRVR
jgi:hypothetical protein